MADYSTIKGFNVQTLSADPPAPGAGQVWYNTTSATLKGYGQQGTGAWASAPALNTGRYGCAGIGTVSTAAIIAGGQLPPPGEIAICESYNGTAWTEVGDMTNARADSGCGGIGSQTAGLVAGMQGGAEAVIALAEEWNGTAWTEVGDLISARKFAAMSTGGTPTAALVFGGGPTPGGTSGTTLNESYNGTAWTELADLNVQRYVASGSGSSTSALTAGDIHTPEGGYVETWDGSSWTIDTALNNKGNSWGSGGGSAPTAWIAGGTPAPTRSTPGGPAMTEHFNGTAWTEMGDIAVPNGLERNTASGSQMSGLASGGYGNPGIKDLSFEWAVPDATKTFTAS